MSSTSQLTQCRYCIILPPVCQFLVALTFFFNFCCSFVSKVFVVIIVCYVFCSFKFLEETFTLSFFFFFFFFFAWFVSQEGSDCLILTFLLGMCLSACSEIRLVIFDAYMSISLIFSDSQSVSRMSRDRE